MIGRTPSTSERNCNSGIAITLGEDETVGKGIYLFILPSQT